MIVTVHLHPILQRQTPDGWQKQLEVTLLSGSTLTDLIPDLGVALPAEALTVEVNGRVAGPDYILHNGDEVYLTPAF